MKRNSDKELERNQRNFSRIIFQAQKSPLGANLKGFF